MKKSPSAYPSEEPRPLPPEVRALLCDYLGAPDWDNPFASVDMSVITTGELAEPDDFGRHETTPTEASVSEVSDEILLASQRDFERDDQTWPHFAGLAAEPDDEVDDHGPDTQADPVSHLHGLIPAMTREVLDAVLDGRHVEAGDLLRRMSQMRPDDAWIQQTLARILIAQDER